MTYSAYPSCQDFLHTTFQKVKERVDVRLQTDSNFSKGASGSEHIIAYAFETAIETLGLADVLEVQGNKPTYRGYIRASGYGFDCALYKKQFLRGQTYKILLVAFEVKNWFDNWLTPRMAKKRVIDRFKAISRNCDVARILIQYNHTPLKMVDRVKNLLKLYGIKTVHLRNPKELYNYVFSTIIKALQKSNLLHKLLKHNINHELTNNKHDTSNNKYGTTTCADSTVQPICPDNRNTNGTTHSTAKKGDTGYG